MREIKISQETATRWYNGTNPELKALALQTYPELAVKELPKTWEELGEIEGYFIHTNCKVYGTVSIIDDEYRDIFATKEQAEASIAMAQLSQLLAKYNNGWMADWSDGKDKYVVYFVEDKINLSVNTYVSRFLTFKDRKTAELFLENFKDLIQTAKPLL